MADIKKKQPSACRLPGYLAVSILFHRLNSHVVKTSGGRHYFFPKLLNYWELIGLEVNSVCEPVDSSLVFISRPTKWDRNRTFRLQQSSETWTFSQMFGYFMLSADNELRYFVPGVLYCCSGTAKSTLRSFGGSVFTVRNFDDLSKNTVHSDFQLWCSVLLQQES